MYFNHFAQGLEPLDLTQTDEFASLLVSARDLGIPTPDRVRYVSRNHVANGLRFHFLEWGEPAAPALLLLHGGNQTAHSWDLVSLALADRYHIIALDQRGHGDTEWPRDGDASRRARAADALALLEALRIENPIVCGHSMGGIVTMTLLSAHPELARKCVLVDVAPEIAPAGARLIGEFVTSVHEVTSLDEFVERVAAYDTFRPREHIRRTVRYNIMQAADGRLVSKHDHRARLGGGTAQAVAAEEGASQPNENRRAPADRATYDEVAHISCPTLIVRGAQSPVLLREAAEHFAAALARGRLVEVPKCGHNVHSQNTSGFLEVVEPFLAEQE